MPSRVTLVECLISAIVVVAAIVSLLGVWVSQTGLNQHARNVSWAISDASRVTEELRRQNSGSACTTPSAGAANPNWDDWLRTTGGGKSLEQASVTVRSQEYVVVSATGGPDPLRITVAVCWRHRNRTFGECAWNGSTLAPQDGVNSFPADGMIESQAMIATAMTCRR